MTSYGGGDSRDPIDPDFAGLFRPEDLAPSALPADPAVQPQDNPPADEQADEPHFEPIMDPVVDPRVEESLHEPPTGDEPGPPEPRPADPVADTGRLFRSQGVADHDEAVLALASDHFGRLRTLERRTDDASAPVLPDAGPITAEGHDADAVAAGVLAAPLSADAAAVTPGDAPSRRGRRGRSAAAGHRSRGITGGAVYLIVIGVTVLVGFANALMSDGDIGWPTGVALLVSSVYAALTVRREDDTVAIIVPPIAFLLASLTAGQLFLGAAEGSLINRAVVVFFSLADNWIWIIGATVAAVAIVLVRRRRS